MGSHLWIEPKKRGRPNCVATQSICQPGAVVGVVRCMGPGPPHGVAGKTAQHVSGVACEKQAIRATIVALKFRL